MRPLPPPLPPPPSAKPVKKRRRSWILSGLGFLFGSAVVLFLAGSAIAGYLLWRASQDLPSYDSLAKYEPPVMTRIHAPLPCAVSKRTSTGWVLYPSSRMTPRFHAST